MIGVGGSIGFTRPTDRFFDNGLGIAGNVEGYLTPRVSVRGQIGTAWWDIIALRNPGTIQPVYFLGNLVYNWEGGKWHPYATGGAGLYHFRFEDPVGVKGSDNNAGFNVGGGIEYFFTRYATITGEALYHKVGDVNTGLHLFADGSFWSFMVGAKRYF